jgi:GMP synthase-like glutamine amidotransferase
MRIHYLQHVPFEEPGIIKDWAISKGYQFTGTKFFKDEELPALDEIDWLVIMGGPMSIYDEIIYTWLSKEKAFVKNAIEKGKTVIGICLGAQIIADVLGASVYKNNHKEIGWFPVKKIITGEKNIFSGLPEEFLAFHWHGETFDIPGQAIHLASSEPCKNQAFIYNNNVLGLQFHMEMKIENVRLIVENCSEEIVTGKYIQTTEEILSQNEQIFMNQHVLFENILNYLELPK